MIYRLPINMDIKEYLKYLKYFEIEAVYDLRKNGLSMNRDYLPVNLEKSITGQNKKYFKYPYKYGYLCDDLISAINTNCYKNLAIIGRVKHELDEKFFEYLTRYCNYDMIYYNENKEKVEIDIPFY